MNINTHTHTPQTLTHRLQRQHTTVSRLLINTVSVTEASSHFQSLSLPGLSSVRPETGGGVGWGGSLNVLIRTGSPGENTQTYLYILFQEGSSPRARRSCIETNSCPSSLPPLGDEPTETLGIQRTFSRSHAEARSLKVAVSV